MYQNPYNEQLFQWRYLWLALNQPWGHPAAQQWHCWLDDVSLLFLFLTVQIYSLSVTCQCCLLLAIMTTAICAQCCASLHLPSKGAKYRRTMTTISSRFDNPQCRCERITLASPPPSILYVLNIPKGKWAIWIVQPVSLIWQMQSSVLLVSYQGFYTCKPSVDQALCLPNLWPRHLCSLWQEASYV